jgi:hypothetical protein
MYNKYFFNNNIIQQMAIQLDEFNLNDYNRAQAYLNNFEQEYAADDNVPSVINISSSALPADYYDRFAYDFAATYVNRHKDNAVVGGRRRSRQQRQRRSRQQQQRRSRQQQQKQQQQQQQQQQQRRRSRQQQQQQQQRRSRQQRRR